MYYKESDVSGLFWTQNNDIHVYSTIIWKYLQAIIRYRLDNRLSQIMQSFVYANFNDNNQYYNIANSLNEITMTASDADDTESRNKMLDRTSSTWHSGYRQWVRYTKLIANGLKPEENNWSDITGMAALQWAKKMLICDLSILYTGTNVIYEWRIWLQQCSSFYDFTDPSRRWVDRGWVCGRNRRMGIEPA